MENDNSTEVLKHIIDLKIKSLEQKQQETSLEELELKLTQRTHFRGLQKKLEQCAKAQSLFLIGGILRSTCHCHDHNVVMNAASQAQSFSVLGAHAIAVASDDTFYYGNEEDIQNVRDAIDLPIIRRDFIVEEYQIVESAVLGADCVILKAACLEHEHLIDLAKLAKDIGLEVIIEIRTIEDLDKLIDLPIRIVCINNTDINTKDTNIETSMNLAGQLPEDYFILSEGGIENEGDVEILLTSGIHGLFVDACVKQEAPDSVFKRLFPVPEGTSELP